MKGKKVVLLFLALLFPVFIFILLKMFGKNEFEVPVLYSDVSPEFPPECISTGNKLPYVIPDSILRKLSAGKQFILGIHFKSGGDPSSTQLQRVIEKFSDDEVEIKTLNSSDFNDWRKCIFLLKEPFDVAVVDKNGTIRGQYKSRDREDIDRMMTELTILLKKY